MNNKPLSQELFEDFYEKMSDKIEESSDTIFTGISIKDSMTTNYKLFIESSYINQFYIDDSLYKKNETIKLFIENEILSKIYTDTYDMLIHESDDSELSFSQCILLENTQETFKVKYLGSSLHKIQEFEAFEEGFVLASALGSAAAFLAAGPIPAAMFGALTFLGVNLLLPARLSKKNDDFFEKWFGNLGKIMMGTKSFLGSGGTALSSSESNIINFDNIDINPNVKAIFNKLARSNDKDAPIKGLNSLVEECLDINNPLNGVDDLPGQGFFRGRYKPTNNSIFTVAINSIFKSGANKSNDNFDVLMRYRKCLSEKLVDMYKFLMIANVSQSREYKKIIRVMKKGFHENPAQLLSFMTIDDDGDKINKENIINLIKFRLFLDEMASELKKGAFDVDKESGTFLEQKLKNVDHEIEDYMSKNQRQINTAHENQEEFNRKDYKYNKVDPKKLKRNLFGLNK